MTTFAFQFLCSVPLTGYLAFFACWLFLLTASVAYFLILFRSIMYFVGMCSYIHAMVDDLSAALVDFDEGLRDQSTAHTAERNSQQALANEIRFHNESIE